MDRRTLLSLAAASVTAALAGCQGVPELLSAPGSNPTSPGRPDAQASPSASGKLFGPPVGLQRDRLPEGRFDFIPDAGRAVALTIDDGADAAVVRAYCDLSAQTGLRLTFFVTGSFPGWTECVDVLRPLVDNGQIFLGNHSWAHPDFVRTSSSEIVAETRRNERYLMNTFGVTGRPFYRPPFGSSNARVRSVLAEHGYPAVAMWSGTLADSTSVAPSFILDQAKQYFSPGRLVLGHADFPSVVKVFDNLVGLLESRKLQPVHLGDVYDTDGAERDTYSVSPEPSPTPTPTPSASASPSKSKKSPSKSPAYPSSPDPSMPEGG